MYEYRSLSDLDTMKNPDQLFVNYPNKHFPIKRYCGLYKQKNTYFMIILILDEYSSLMV